MHRLTRHHSHPLLAFDAEPTIDRLRAIEQTIADDEARGAIDDADLTVMEADLMALFDAIRAGQVDDVDRSDVDVLGAIERAVEGVRTEANARFDAAAEAQAQAEAREAEAEAIARRMRGEDEQPEGDPADDGDEAGGDPADPAPDAADPAPADPAPADPAPAAPQAADDVDPALQPVPAGGSPALPGLGDMAARTPAVPAAPARTNAPMTVRVLAERRDVPLAEFAQVMIDRREDFGDFVGQGSEDVRIGRQTIDLPPEQTLRALDGPEVNSAKIEALVAGALDPQSWADDAIVASGGWCAPTPADYGLAQISGAQRPVRDSLPRTQVDRGGIRFMTPPNISQVLADGSSGAAVGVWTNTTDTTPGESTKSKQVVSCGTPVEVLLEAIYRQLQFGNFVGRAFPEWVQTWIANTAAVWARFSEQRNLDAIDANTTKVTTTQVFGTTRDLLAYVIQLAVAERNRQRMDVNARLRVMLPAWVIGSMQQDWIRQGNLRVEVPTEATIRALFAAANINLTFYEDTRTGAGQIVSAQGGGNDMRDLPQTVEWFLFHEGAFVHLDGGTLDLGLVRDSTLNSTNDYRIFAETFENVAYRGIFAYRVRSAICPNGVAALPLDKASTICAAS